MKKLILYPEVKVKGQDYSKVKSVTVPNQSMSLKEIIQRFMRRESLPVSKEGVYNDQLGDLEKIKNLDMTEQVERIEELKTNIARATARMELKEKARVKAEQEAQEAAQKAATQQTPNSGVQAP